jgi:hypothetical protein
MKNSTSLVIILAFISMANGIAHAMTMPEILQETSKKSKEELIKKVTYSFNYFQPTDIKIEAKKDNECIGQIYFELRKGNRWEITSFEIEKPYRNCGIGCELFKRCLAEVKSQKGHALYWDIIPNKENQLSLATLFTIYEKIIKKAAPELLGSLKRTESVMILEKL